MKYSKEQLIEMVKPYFENDKVNLLYVTEDNQVFYPSGKTQAFSHARVYKLRSPFEISRADIEAKKEVKKPAVKKEAKKAKKEELVKKEPTVDQEKETLIEMAKEAGIKVDDKMDKEAIEKLIKDKENARE